MNACYVALSLLAFRDYIGEAMPAVHMSRWRLMIACCDFCSTYQHNELVTVPERAG